MTIKRTNHSNYSFRECHLHVIHMFTQSHVVDYGGWSTSVCKMTSGNHKKTFDFDFGIYSTTHTYMTIAYSTYNTCTFT